MDQVKDIFDSLIAFLQQLFGIVNKIVNSKSGNVSDLLDSFEESGVKDAYEDVKKQIENL